MGARDEVGQSFPRTTAGHPLDGPVRLHRVLESPAAAQAGKGLGMAAKGWPVGCSAGQGREHRAGIVVSLHDARESALSASDRP
jgi:hypothetical protein